MSNEEWPEVKLGDHVHLLSGFAFRSRQFTDEPEDIPLVKGANVHQGFIDWENAKRWPASDVKDYQKFFLEEGDVVLAMDRPWIEAGLKWAWIRPEHPRALLVQRVARMRGLEGFDTCYLRYIIGSLKFTDYIRPIVTGVNVPHISGEQIKNFSFRLPPLPTQRKIVSILSAYDDLIENNTRRIAILEEMAQAIYREWFVNFRFPGHENVKLVDSPLGQIPEGWEVGELQHLVSFANGKSIRPGGEGEYVAFGSNGPIGRSHEFLYQCGIIIGRVGAYCGSVAYSPHPFWASDNTIVALSQHDDSFIPFVLYMLQGMNLNRHAGGAAQPLLTQTTLKKLQIVTPPNETMEVFCEVVSLILTETSCLENKNENLRTTRDLLLPKLISGKLDVEDLDIDTGLPEEEFEEAVV